MISGLNEQPQQELEYTLLKPDYHSWWILKNGIWTWGHFRRTICTKNLFKLGKNAAETNRMFQTSFGASVFEWHTRFNEGRESVRADERSGSSREVNTLDWLAKGLGLGLLCWGFEGVQGEIPWEATSNLQIGSVAFPPGQCTSP